MYAITYWSKQIKEFLLDKTITKVEYSQDDSLNERLYGNKLIEMELSDGTALAVNGTLFYHRNDVYEGGLPMVSKDGKDIYLDETRQVDAVKMYNFFLFSQLAQANNMVDTKLEYDLMFGRILKLWDKFNASHYINNIDESYYDNIIHFFINEE